MPESFRAWVPCITGNLSFSQIGRIGFPKATRSIHTNFDDCCYVDCAEIRTSRLDDSLFMLRSRPARKAHKNVVFSLIGSARKLSNNQPYLRGTVFCHIGHYTPGDVKDGTHRYKQYAFKCDFILSRSGKLTLCNMNIGPRLRQSVSQNGTLAVEYLFRQTYFFIKDMVHRHRHHRVTDDTFIECSLGASGYTNRIAYQLAKRVIRRPIDKESNTYQSALGILAYLQSYQSVSGSKVYSDINLQTTKSSLQAEYNNVRASIENRKWMGAAIVSIYTYINSKASFWKDGLDLFDGGPELLWQLISITAFIVMVVTTAFLSRIINPPSWFWYQELMKVPTAFQANKKLSKRAAPWLVVMLLSSVMSIVCFGSGQNEVGFILSAVLFVLVAALTIKIYKMTTGDIQQ